jgi:IS30 family transposase
MSGWLFKDKQESISHESIYLHVWANKKTGGDLYTYLRRQGKKYDKRRKVGVKPQQPVCSAYYVPCYGC